MADDGLDTLEEMIRRPRRVTPSLAGGRPRNADAPTYAGGGGKSSSPPAVPTSSHKEVVGPRRTKVAMKGGGDRPSFAARKLQVQLRVEQEEWLHRIVADGLRDGVRVSEADVVRVAMDRLREGRAGWSELREAIFAETKQRSRRR